MADERHGYGASRLPVEGTAAREAELAVLASRQHGVVARHQLVELGFGRQAIQRRLEARRLRRLHPGVYAVGHWALTSASRDLAAVLACGSQALLSHRAAGARLGLSTRGSGLVEVTAPRGFKPKPGIAVHTTRLIHPDDRSIIDGIPTTSVARTIVDLADVLDERRLAAVVNEAEVLRVFDLSAIERTVARLPRRRGARRLRRAISAYTDPLGYSTTKAERLLLRLCRHNDLPQPSRVVAAGFELDFYWADARLAVEVDGGAFHRTPRAFYEDRARDRALAAEGIQVARVTWLDLSTKDAKLAAELHAIRRRRVS